MYHLYSHNDLDGVGCGIIAKCAFGEQVEIRYNSVEGLNFQVERFLDTSNNKKRKDDELFITDLSVNEYIEQGLNVFAQEGGKIKLIDHHKTALHFNQYPWGFVQVQYNDGRLASATSLFYDHLVERGFLAPSGALAEFVELIRQYDTWEWDRNDNVQAKRLNDLFFMVSIDEFEEKMVERLQKHEHFSFDKFEEKILDMEEEKIERYVRKKRRELVQTFIDERCVGIVHAESYHSELGNELGKDNPHLDYIAILNMGGKRASFRTIHDDIDVSQIAGRYGGGGHAKASGCSLTNEFYQLYVAEPFHIEPMRADAFRNTYNLKSSDYGSVYENRKNDKLYIYPMNGQWHIECNGEQTNDTFASFEEAERFVKRYHSAWLVRDEIYVKLLMEHMIETKSRTEMVQ